MHCNPELDQMFYTDSEPTRFHQSCCFASVMDIAEKSKTARLTEISLEFLAEIRSLRVLCSNRIDNTKT